MCLVYQVPSELFFITLSASSLVGLSGRPGIHLPTYVCSGHHMQKTLIRNNVIMITMPSHRLTLVLGDLNARVGTASDSWHGIIVFFGCPRRPPPPPHPLHPGQGCSRRRHGTREVPAAGSSSSSSSSSSDTSPFPPSGPPGRHAMANDDGIRCLCLCAAHDMAVCNTFLRHRDAQTATWRSPNGRDWATLDYVLINRP